MHRRFYATSLAALSLIGVSACTQFPRHSNTMVFGTVTSFGLTVGAGATSVPTISVGYQREEAVVLPLVANTGDNGTNQVPCPQGGGAIVPVTTPLPAGCLLQGSVADRKDAYSVLASFGANFDASGNVTTTDPKNPSAKVGAEGALAQYFSTGVAAQILAAQGGASVVALGTGARQPSSDGASALMALAGQTPGVRSKVVTEAFRQSSLEALANLVENDKRTDPEVVKALADAADKADVLHNSCKDKNDCSEAITGGNYFPGIGEAATDAVTQNFRDSIPS